MDLEARAHSEHPEALRLWLRLLTCTQLVEKQVRTALREQFDTTLPRFDLMAQLERTPDGLRMNELSRRMMVTGGNVTGITDQLVAEGLVERIDVAGDRRAWRVRLTAQRAHRVRRDGARARRLDRRGLRRPGRRRNCQPAPACSARSKPAFRRPDEPPPARHPATAPAPPCRRTDMKHFIGPTNPMRGQFEAKAATPHGISAGLSKPAWARSR